MTFIMFLVGDNVTAACMTLFDVATFKQDAISFASDIASMYARNVLRHLPKINMLNFGNENNFSNFDFVLNELENWYYCAKCGVKYTTYYRSSDMFPSCVSIEFCCFKILVSADLRSNGVTRDYRL